MTFLGWLSDAFQGFSRVKWPKIGDEKWLRLQSPGPLSSTNGDWKQTFFFFVGVDVQLMVNCWFGARWFGILGVHPSNHPFYKGIPGIQTTGPQTNNEPLADRCFSKRILYGCCSCQVNTPAVRWLFVDSPKFVPPINPIHNRIVAVVYSLCKRHWVVPATTSFVLIQKFKTMTEITWTVRIPEVYGESKWGQKERTWFV